MTCLICDEIANGKVTASNSHFLRFGLGWVRCWELGRSCCCCRRRLVKWEEKYQTKVLTKCLPLWGLHVLYENVRAAACLFLFSKKYLKYQKSSQESIQIRDNIEKNWISNIEFLSILSLTHRISDSMAVFVSQNTIMMNYVEEFPRWFLCLGCQK